MTRQARERAPFDAATGQHGEPTKSRDAGATPSRRPRMASLGCAVGKEGILAAAVENFVERGYHGTSTRDIARAAGVTPAAIYHHFASKQHLLQVIMENALRECISLTSRSMIRSGGSPEDQLGSVMRAWVLFHAISRSTALICASEMRSLDKVGRLLIESLRDQQEQLFRTVIERGVVEGAFSTPFPSEAARSLIDMGYSIAAWYRADLQITPDEVADRYTALAFGTVGCLRERLPAESPSGRAGAPRGTAPD